MQPSPRPPMPHGNRPLGPPLSHPPPLRPPDGYRPTLPPGGGNQGPPMKPFNSPMNPPIQKMAQMNINPSGYQQQPGGQMNMQQRYENSISNGMPERNSATSPINTDNLNSVNQLSMKTSVNNVPNLSREIDQKRTDAQHSRNLAQEDKSPMCYTSQSSSFPHSIDASSPSAQTITNNDLSNKMSQASTAPTIHSQNSLPVSAGSMQPSSMPPSNIGTHPSSMPSSTQGMNPSNPHMHTSPAMHSSTSFMPPGTQGMSTSMPGMPSTIPGMAPTTSIPPSTSGMPPSTPSMPPSTPGMPPSTPGMPPSTPGMPPSTPGMPPSTLGVPSPGMHSFASNMSNSISGMSPSAPSNLSPIPQTGSGMPVSSLGTHSPSFTASPVMPPPGASFSQPGPSSGMLSPRSGPPRPGVSPRQNLYPPGPAGGMSPYNASPHNSSMGPQSPRMPPQMKPPMMTHSGSPMMPPTITGPAGSPMMPPTITGAAGSPMMPPSNAGSPMMPPSNAGSPMMPPSYSGPQGMATSPVGNIPPGQQPPHSMGGMQNRYPGSTAGGTGYAQGQGRRLNPDDMPSPLQVMEDDRQTKSGEFFTNMKGAVPPLVTTDYFVKDGGNASPRFIRSTMYSIPATPDLMKQATVPFGLIISPLADLQLNEGPIYLGTSLANGPVRCNRCKAYMSPLMVFMNGGRRFQCLLCKHVNEVPPEYHCHMDSQGARADKYQRPELCLGSYEFVATPEYCLNKILPKEPAYIFVMEMSQIMLQRGIISILCQNMKSLLQNLPKDHVTASEEQTKSPIKVGFITYDSSVHFYKFTGLAPEMCVLCDKENMFVPVPDGVLCNVDEAIDNIDALMECIPENFQTTRETSGSLYGAIEAGMAALKASGRSGKLFVFHSSLPVCEGPGKLKNREDRKALGTEKEKTILTPQTQNYNHLAQELVSAGCGVDLFIFNESYIDLATIGQVARLTGGQCYKYSYFQPNKDAERLLEDLKINIGRNIVFDAVMRVRTSTGVRPSDFYGHFFMSNTQDVELAAVDSSKAIAIEVKHDDKITEDDGVYIQVALLFTSIGGQRRIRILNLALNVCTQLADLYKNCELDALMNFFSKQSSFKFLETTVKQVKENLVARTAQMLACYRKNCASPSSAGQLILPELMKLLPLYVNCLMKCDALSGGPDLTCDERSWHLYRANSMTVEGSLVYLYPRLIPLTNIDLQGTDVPPAIRTSFDRLTPDGAFLLENGLFMFLWVGSGVSSTWMSDVFGVAAPHQLDPMLSELPELENVTSKRIRGIIASVREQRNEHLRMFVVPQQGKHEVIMKNYLLEDKIMSRGPSYVDFLCHVHKEIRGILS